MKKIFMAIMVTVLMSSPVFAASYDIKAECSVASGTGSFIYYDNNSNYHTISVVTRYFYKDAWGVVRNNSSSNLTNENNTWVKATVGPKSNDSFSMSFATEVMGYVDNNCVATKNKYNPLAVIN